MRQDIIRHPPFTYIISDEKALITACDFADTYIEIPDTLEGYPVTDIGDGAFNSCTALLSITIPSSVTSIGKNAFSDCRITDIHYNGSDADWDKISIDASNVSITNATVHYKPSIVYGDTNGDGNINSLDRAYIARYLAKWAEYGEDKINIWAADANSDSKVNALDRAVISRHIAKWSGYETLPKK